MIGSIAVFILSILVFLAGGAVLAESSTIMHQIIGVLIEGFAFLGICLAIVTDRLEKIERHLRPPPSPRAARPTAGKPRPLQRRVEPE